MSNDYDVIIVGGGGAGLTAACTAIENGASVLVVEAGEKLGGSTALSGGQVYAAGTSVQRANGVNADTAEDVFRYYMMLNRFVLDPQVAHAYCEEAPRALEWLIGLGVEFPAEELYIGSIDGHRRVHCPKGLGAGIIAALENRLSGKADVALRTRVRRLLVEDRCVRGIWAEGQAFRAGAVVVACGGFGANAALFSQFYPNAAAAGDQTWYIGNAHSQGDYFDLGACVDADVAGFNRGLLLATPSFRNELEVYQPSWLVYVNRDGRRFVNETMQYAIMESVIRAQPGGECFALFDDDSRAAAAPDPVWMSYVKKGLATTCWTPEALSEFIRDGKIICAASLEELARRVGIAWPALQATIDTYNSDCERQIDSVFEKGAGLAWSGDECPHWRPVRRAPFYAARIRPAVVCFTATGLRIDADARVQSRLGGPISGLFAAGESAGGVLGDITLGSGASMANVLSFGRIAGRNAAADAKSF